MIPTRLQHQKFRFVLLQGKKPFEEKWQEENNYSFDSIKLLNHIKIGGNYGVVGGYGNLLVIDFDNQEFQDKHLSLLPETFTVKTGSGKYHLYYICEEPHSFKILDKDKNTLADVQGKGKQVVGAGSVHPDTKNKYVVEKDIEISKITNNTIRYVFQEYLKEKDKKTSYTKDNTTEDIKYSIKLKDLLSDYGYDLTRNPTMCKLGHDSKGGACFSYKEEVWYCFHCDEGGDIFNLVMLHEDFKFIDTLSYFKRKLGMGVYSGKKVEDNKEIYGLKIINYVENVTILWQRRPFCYDRAKIFWIWNKDKYYWEIVDETDILIMIDQELNFFGQLATGGIRNNYLEAFRQVGRQKMPETPIKTWIQFKSKIYDIKNNIVMEATPKYFMTNPIPQTIGLTEETPIMDKLFLEWVGKDYVLTLYEIIAYCCLSDYPIHLLFCFTGSGRNGKTQYQKIIQKFFEIMNVCSTELDLLIDNRFESTKLFKKLVCTLGETNFEVMSKTSLLKKLTGGDLIGFEFKNKMPFDDYNYAKIIINSNSLPTSLDTSDGFYRRWMIIDFPNEFEELGYDIIDTIPEIEYQNLAKKMLRILPELLKRGKFTNQGTVDDRKKRFIMASNPLPFFVEKYCYTNVSDNSYSRSSELYLAFTQYLVKHKRRAISRKEFNKALLEEGFEARRTMKTINGEYVRDWYIDFLCIRQDLWDGKCLKPLSEEISNFDTLSTTLHLLPLSRSPEVKVLDKVVKVDNVSVTDCPQPFDFRGLQSLYNDLPTTLIETKGKEENALNRRKNPILENNNQGLNNLSTTGEDIVVEIEEVIDEPQPNNQKTYIKKVERVYHRCKDCNTAPCEYISQDNNAYYCSSCSSDTTNFEIYNSQNP